MGAVCPKDEVKNCWGRAAARPHYYNRPHGKCLNSCCERKLCGIDHLFGRLNSEGALSGRAFASNNLQCTSIIIGEHSRESNARGDYFRISLCTRSISCKADRYRLGQSRFDIVGSKD